MVFIFYMPAISSKALALCPFLVKSERQRLITPFTESLENLRGSGRFRHCGQVIFDNVEPCDAGRYLGLALSQGLIQTLLKAGSQPIRDALEEFSEVSAATRQRPCAPATDCTTGSNEKAGDPCGPPAHEASMI
jgi:hypothetical protein